MMTNLCILELATFCDLFFTEGVDYFGEGGVANLKLKLVMVFVPLQISNIGNLYSVQRIQ